MPSPCVGFKQIPFGPASGIILAPAVEVAAYCSSSDRAYHSVQREVGMTTRVPDPADASDPVPTPGWSSQTAVRGLDDDDSSPATGVS
ncbi:MAG: hypothetical protein ACXW02_08150, partial [Halobacteriota archaeon]